MLDGCCQHAGLIGFPSSGKTALFQLLTSAREAPRARRQAGRATSASPGCPTTRLDQLTALFNPKKHVPATVEFADMGGAAGAKAGRGRPARRRAVPQRRRAAARRPHVPRSVGAARGRLGRSRARRAHDGRRSDPRGPRRRRAAARTARARSEEGRQQRRS